MNLRSIANQVMGARSRGGAGGAGRPAGRPAGGAAGGTSSQDAAIGRGVRKLFKRLR